MAGVNSGPGLQGTLISLYVGASKVVGLASFLLIVAPRAPRGLWIGLALSVCGHTPRCLLFLIETRRCTQHGSFGTDRFLAGASSTAMALILVGCWTKAGLFVSGSWLPSHQCRVATEVSAIALRRAL